MLKQKSVLQPGWSNNLSPASRLWLNRITTWKPHHYYPSNLLQLFPYFIYLEWVNATDLRCPIWPPCCAWAKFLHHASLTEQIAAPEAAWFIHSCLPIPVKRGQWSRKSTGCDLRRNDTPWFAYSASSLLRLLRCSQGKENVKGLLLIVYVNHCSGVRLADPS